MTFFVYFHDECLSKLNPYQCAYHHIQSVCKFLNVLFKCVQGFNTSKSRYCMTRGRIRQNTFMDGPTLWNNGVVTIHKKKQLRLKKM